MLELNFRQHRRQLGLIAVCIGIGVPALSGCDEPIAVTGVSLDPSTLAMVVGETETLVATVAPEDADDPALSWSSSDTGVATVDEEGEVTALAAGTTTITVTTSDGDFTDTCIVTVTDTAIAVTGVSLDRETLELVVGSAPTTLVATIQPVNATNTDVAWESSDTDVATVSATGQVTAVAEGTATITVTTDDGGFTDTVEVTVSAGVPTAGVTLDTDALELTFGGATATLVATVSPVDATNTDVTWMSSDTDVVTVSATGVLTAVGSGVAEITVTTEDGSFTDTAEVTVVPDAVTGMVATTPLTGQAIITWTAAADPNATGVEVTMTSPSGTAVILPEQFVPVGTNQIVLSGLSFPESYTISIVVGGAAETVSNTADVPVSTVEVTRILRTPYMEAGNHFVMISTIGSSSTETHDIVIARQDENIPRNYRWALYPGLADPSDPALVSLMLQRYNETSSEWESSNRYVRISASHTHASNGQWYGWANPNPNSHIAWEEPNDSSTGFAEEATFAMVAGAGDGEVAFEWYPDRTRRLLHTFYHVMAQDTIAVGDRFAADSSWVLEPVSYRTP